MAAVTITNVTSGDTAEDIYIRDLYTTVPVGEARTIQRSASELPAMRSLQDAVAGGKVTVAVQYTAEELASGFPTAPAAVEAGDLAPVAALVPLGPVAAVYKRFAAGSGGAPDDVEVYPVGAVPFKLRVLDVVAYIQTPVGGAALEVRDAPARGGNLLASVSAAAAGRIPNAEVATTELSPGETKGLFIHRTDSGVAGELVLTVRPEL